MENMFWNDYILITEFHASAYLKLYNIHLNEHIIEKKNLQKKHTLNILLDTTNLKFTKFGTQTKIKSLKLKTLHSTKIHIMILQTLI